jgi:hypothetical protein
LTAKIQPFLTNRAEPSAMRKLALALALALAPAAALAASLDVPLDQSTFVALPGPAHNVIIGNPAIADVSVADQRHLIITGKGAGITNLVVTDPAGRPIFDRQIVVGAGSGDRVALINGGQVVSYACAPRCEIVGGAGGSAAAAAPATGGGSPEVPHPSGSVSASPNTP